MRAFARLLALACASRGADSFKVSVTYSDASLAEYAMDTEQVCKEWYPKIDEILFGTGHPLPYNEVRVIFETPENSKFDGWTSMVTDDPSPIIHLIHELTHEDQHYADGSPTWLGDGIADYVPYTYFTKNNEPRLHLDQDCYLTGYTDSIPFLFSMQKAKMKPGPDGGYTVTSAFLLWLEINKDKAIVHKLNAALRGGT